MFFKKIGAASDPYHVSKTSETLSQDSLKTATSQQTIGKDETKKTLMAES